MFRQVVMSSTRPKLSTPFGHLNSSRTEDRDQSEILNDESHRTHSAGSNIKPTASRKRRPWTAGECSLLGKIKRLELDDKKADKENVAQISHCTKKSDSGLSCHQSSFIDDRLLQNNQIFNNHQSTSANEDLAAIARLQKVNVRKKLRDLRSAFAERAEHAKNEFAAKLTTAVDSDEEDDLLRPPASGITSIRPDQLEQLLESNDTTFERLLDAWATESLKPETTDESKEQMIRSTIAKIPESSSNEGEDEQEDEESELADELWLKSSTNSSQKLLTMRRCAFGLWRALLNRELPTLYPQSVSYVLWLLIVSVAFIYNAWYIPFRAIFDQQFQPNENRRDFFVDDENVAYDLQTNDLNSVPINETFQVNFTDSWLSRSTNQPTFSSHLKKPSIYFRIDLFADLVYLLDMLIFKTHLRFVHNGLWVKEPNVTRQQYLKSQLFFLDLFAVVPIDLILWVSGANVGIEPKPEHRINRLLKIDSFWQFFLRFDSIARFPHLVRIARTLCYMMFLVHLNACAYYWLSWYLGFASDGWVYSGQGNAYLRCFYFSLRTATSISGKMPKPVQSVQRLYMAGSWLLGVFVFAFLIGQIRDIVANASRQQALYRVVSDRISMCLQRLHAPSTLQARVRQWLAYTWQQQRTLDEQEILRLLPSKCRLDIALSVHYEVLRKVRLFRGCERSAIRELLVKLRPVQFLPGDWVFKEGDIGSQMYIVGSGQLQVWSAGGQLLATISQGAVFGELAILQLPGGSSRRTASVRALGYCTLFQLSKIDLWDTLSSYPSAQQLLRKRAKALMRKRKAAARAELEAQQKLHPQPASISDVIRAESVIGGGVDIQQRMADMVVQVMHLLKEQKPHSAPS